MTYPCTFYTRPNGRADLGEITKIRPVAESYFREHTVAISMEDCGVFYTIWADDGTKTEDGEPAELTYIVPDGQSCEDALDAIVEELKRRTK